MRSKRRRVMHDVPLSRLNQFPVDVLKLIILNLTEETDIIAWISTCKTFKGACEDVTFKHICTAMYPRLLQCKARCISIVEHQIRQINPIYVEKLVILPGSWYNGPHPLLSDDTPICFPNLKILILDTEVSVTVLKIFYGLDTLQSFSFKKYTVATHNIEWQAAWWRCLEKNSHLQTFKFEV